jgi:Lycopene cyclase
VAGTYTTAYLIGALLFVPVWLALYWRYPAGRREMLVMSGIFVVIGVPMELLIYSKDWWHPETISGTTVGIEDVIYSIGNGGYMAALFGAVFRGQPVPARAAPGWLARLAPLAAISLLPLALFYGLGVHSFVGTTIGSLIALGLILAKRRDLIHVGLVTAGIGTALAIPVYFIMEAVFPGWIAATWDLRRLSGILVAGIPLEDLVWYLYTSALWSTYYKFATGVRLERSVALVSGRGARRAAHSPL